MDLKFIENLKHLNHASLTNKVQKGHCCFNSVPTSHGSEHLLHISAGNIEINCFAVQIVVLFSRLTCTVFQI